MAIFKIQEDQLLLQFSRWEKLGGLRSGAKVQLTDIQSIETVANPWPIIEGLRVGTGMPWVIVLGTMLRRGGNDVVAVYKKRPAVVVTLRTGSAYQRLIATVPNPEQVVAAVQLALRSNQ